MIWELQVACEGWGGAGRIQGGGGVGRRITADTRERQMSRADDPSKIHG